MRRFPVLAVLALGWCASASAAEDEGALPGWWQYDYKAFAAKATIHMQLGADQSCLQVAKAKVVGITQWAALRCTWKVEGQELVLSIKDATDAKTVGTDTRLPVVKLTATGMRMESGDKSMDWTRTQGMPAEYAEHLAGWDRDAAKRAAERAKP